MLDPKVDRESEEQNYKSLSSQERIDLANIQKNLGNHALKEDRIEEAIHHYSEMIQIDPLSVVGHCNRSQAHYKNKDFQSGLEDAIKAVNLEPENTKALYRRYTGYLYTNRVPEAIQDLKAILARDPTNQQVLEDLQNAEFILLSKKENDDLATRVTDETDSQNNPNSNAIPLKVEEEQYSLNFSDISNILNENLRANDDKIYEDISGKIDALKKSLNSPISNDDQEKLNKILHYLNDLDFYFTVNEPQRHEIEEILYQKKLILKDMIAFELKKAHPDHSKALVFINSLIKICEKENFCEIKDKRKNLEEIIELLKKRCIIHESVHNHHFAKQDIEQIKKIKAEMENSGEKKQVEDEEKKQEFTISNENRLKSALKVKEKGVEHFKNGHFKEALSFFHQAQKIFENEFPQEIKNKTPFVLDDYVKVIRNLALSHFQMKEYQQADEKLDFLLSILPGDQRTLEIKANNFQVMAVCNSKIYEGNHEMLKKYQETLQKLIDSDTVSKSDKNNYQEQLKKIESEILKRDPEHKKKQKMKDDFEKKIKNFTFSNNESHDSFLLLLKEQNFEALENVYKLKPLNEGLFIPILTSICQNPNKETEFKINIMKFLRNACHSKLDFNLGFLDGSEKKDVKKFFDEIYEQKLQNEDIDSLRLAFKLN